MVAEAFTAFVTDVYSRRIVGWRTTNRMPAELPVDALEMELWVGDRAGHGVDGLIHHSGNQFTDGQAVETTRTMGVGHAARDRRVVYQWSFERSQHDNGR